MISIVVPTHERHNSLLRLINSVKLQTLLPAELIIVSNLKDNFLVGSAFQQATLGIQTSIAYVGEVGANRARNLGLKKAKEEIVLFLDDDCEFDNPNFLKRLVELHKNHKQALVIGGSYKIPLQAQPIDKAYNIVARSWQTPEFYGDSQSWRLFGGNLSFKRLELLATNEVFNEDIIYGGTEAELLKRLQGLGREGLFIESLEILHHTRLDEKKLVSKAYHQALTHSLFNIDGGFEDNYYQNRKAILAKESSSNDEEYAEILFYIELYNQVFSLAQKEQSLRKARLRGRKLAFRLVENRSRTMWL